MISFADAQLNSIANNSLLSSESSNQDEEENLDSSDTDSETSSEHNSICDTSLDEQSSDSDKPNSSSSESVSDTEKPFCAGAAVKRKTFDAAFLAVSNKHSFSKTARDDLIKFLNIVLPDPNLASSNYMFGKKIIETMDVHFTMFQLCVKCNTELTEGMCPNEDCVVFNRKLHDHEIEICYFIPIKDQLQRILTGMFSWQSRNIISLENFNT